MKRSEIDVKYTWNAEEIVSGREEFIKRVNALSKQLNFSKFKGKLNNREAVLDCFKAV